MERPAGLNKSRELSSYVDSSFRAEISRGERRLGIQRSGFKTLDIEKYNLPPLLRNTFEEQAHKKIGDSIYTLRANQTTLAPLAVLLILQVDPGAWSISVLVQK